MNEAEVDNIPEFVLQLPNNHPQKTNEVNFHIAILITIFNYIKHVSSNFEEEKYADCNCSCKEMYSEEKFFCSACLNEMSLKNQSKAI